MIYLDNNATTSLAPEVSELVTELSTVFGNASSVHGPGRQARLLLNESREKIAELLNVSEKSLVFTSGGTEAINAAMMGVFLPKPQGKHLIVSAVEHPAVLCTAEWLQVLGVELSILPVDSLGRIHLEQLEELIRPHTVMIALMYANNEIGNLYPVKEVGDLARKHGVTYLCDAVQAVGKLPLDLSQLAVDFLSASAHKFHGPKGVGFLYIKSSIKDSQNWEPLIRGGRQERGQRAGTENVLGIAAMAKALELAVSKQEARVQFVKKLRDHLQEGLLKIFPEAQVLGDVENRLYNTLNIRIPGVSGETALMQLDLKGVAISIGSACESGSVEPSHVLKAMGLSDGMASSGLRFSFSKDNTESEVEEALKVVQELWNKK